MKHRPWLFLALIAVLLLYACAPSRPSRPSAPPVETAAPSPNLDSTATEMAATATEMAATATEVAVTVTEVAVTVTPQAENAATAGPEVKLEVMAAASLTEPFKEIGKYFESRNPGVTVEFNFAGSQQLAQQLASGAQADVFASASTKYMDTLVNARRVEPSRVVKFASNRLVVILPKANPGGLQSLKDLAKPGLKLVLADKAVPAGQYSLDFLSKAGQDPGYGSGFKDAVLKNVVSYEDNVKSVLTKISLGEGDAGIVYTTDAAGSAAEKVSQISIPDELNVIAVYPVAPLADGKSPTLGSAFIGVLMSETGQGILKKYGFLPPQ
jgi:molybdate transport system substrate-binding protein